MIIITGYSKWVLRFDHTINKLFVIITTGFNKQNFLGQPMIPFLLKITPKKKQMWLALRIIGISPHYFIYQWSSTKYPLTMSRTERLKAEHLRNSSTRKQICNQILRPYLKPNMTVLDFGCGLGYLSNAVAKYTEKVHAVDISCGAIECAKILNPANNLFYSNNNGKDLTMFNDNSFDLIYSFAVVQHLSDKLFEGFLKEFLRILKPSGQVVCHIVLDDNPQSKSECYEKSSIFSIIYRPFKRFELHSEHRSFENVLKKIVDNGFKPLTTNPIKQISDVDDDIVNHHLFVFMKT